MILGLTTITPPIQRLILAEIFCRQQASQRLLYFTWWRVVHTEKLKSDWSFAGTYLIICTEVASNRVDRFRTFITLTSHERHGGAKHSVVVLLSQQLVDHATQCAASKLNQLSPCEIRIDYSVWNWYIFSVNTNSPCIENVLRRNKDVFLYTFGK